MKINSGIVCRILWLFCLSATAAIGQNVGINATGASPDSSAGLDVSFTNKGLLIPQVALTATSDAATINRPATGLLVYNLGTGGLSPAGYYYNSGTKAVPVWVNVASANWSITGNSGTVDGTNFIGTTDSIPINFRIRNNKSGRIDPAGPVFIGYKAGNINNDYTNTGVGFKSLYLVTAAGAVDVPNLGGANTALGYKALYNNIWYYNTAIGYKAMYMNTTGYRNVAVGADALGKNTTGTYNVAIGQKAMLNNTIGFDNTAVGFAALQNDTSSSDNAAVGYQALMSVTNGSYNAAVGRDALWRNTIGTRNVAVGTYAQWWTTTGTDNTAIGYNSLYGPAGVAFTGSYNTIIGSGANATITTLSRTTAIGYNAKVSASNCMVLGGTGADTVYVGIGLTAPLALLHLKDGHLRSEQTTAPSIAVTTANGITAAAIAANSTDTKGTITTTGTNGGTNTVLTITFNKTYIIAPTVVISAANATAQACTHYVTSALTNFVLNFSGGGATPSFNYMIIE